MYKPIRPIRIEGNIAYAPLTRGAEAIIDAADVHLVRDRNWAALKPRRVFYAVASFSDKSVYMHRLIMGGPAGLLIDHIDSNGLNNCRPNLRVVTQRENAHNARRRIDNTSGFKGVCWDKHAGKWRADIAVDRRAKHLGVFDTPENAYAAYCEASARLHGAYGRVG